MHDLLVAQLKDNKVVSLGSGEFEEPPTDPNVIILDSHAGIKLGDIYNGDGTFTSVTQYRTNLSRSEFRNKFTQDEKVALYTAADTDIKVKIFLDDVLAAENIELTDTETVKQISYLAASGVIDESRAPEILAGVVVE